MARINKSYRCAIEQGRNLFVKMASAIRKGSTAHRQLDVDQYDDERYIEASETENLSSALASTQSQVDQMLSSGRAEDALKLVVSEPLYKADQALKVRKSCVRDTRNW